MTKTILQTHATAQLNRPWKMTQLGLLSLAAMPLLGGVLLIGSSVLVTRRRWSVMGRRSLNRGLLLLGLLLMVSSSLSALPGEAWLGMAHFLPYFWLLAAQAELIASPKQLRQGAVLIALTVAPLVLLGFAELFLGWSSPPGLAGILPWPPNGGGTPPGRMASVFGYANSLALYLNMALALLLGLWGRCYRSAPSELSSAALLNRAPFNTVLSNADPAAGPVGRPVAGPREQTQSASDAVALAFPLEADEIHPRDAGSTAGPTVGATRGGHSEGHLGSHSGLDLTGDPWLAGWSRSRRLLLWSLLILLCLVGLVLTQSRSAWGLALLSGLAMAIYWGWTWLAAAVVGLAGSIFWAAFGPFGKGPLRQVIPEFFWARLTDQNFSDRPLATLRITQWQFALNLSETKPLTGWGLRNFSHLYQDATGLWMGHPHNLFLMLPAETGWFITGGLLGLIGWIFYRGIEVIQVKNRLNTADCYLFFGILIAFLNTICFHFFDIPLFDFRINALGWMTVSQILGVVYLSDAGNLNLGRTEQLKTD